MRHGAAIAAAVTALLIAACGGGGDGKKPASTTTEPTAAPTTPATIAAGVAPLTGLPGDPARLKRPALVVKIDNAPKARPQAGINHADIVVEEGVEGGITRFAAIFHSGDSDPVGPGAIGAQLRYRHREPADQAALCVQRDESQFRAAARQGPVDQHRATVLPRRIPPDERAAGAVQLLLGDVDIVQRGRQPITPAHRPSSATAPRDVAPPGGQPAGGVHIEFRGRVVTAIDWAWDAAAGVWKRMNNGTAHVDAAGVQASAANVVIEFVNYKDTGERDQSGAVVPHAELVGEGEAWVLTNGQVVKGRWQKASPEALTRLVTADGQPIALDCGPDVGGAPRSRTGAAPVRKRLPALLAALGLVATACGSSKGGALPRVDTTAPTTTTTAPPALAPFTGQSLFNPEVASRPAVMIKVGDDPKARPQAGLDKADVVYEERVEGNVVRFLAVYQSQDAKSVGPIRSVRSSDAGVVAAIGGVFVYSGGIAPFDSLMRRLGLTVISEEVNATAFHLRSDRQRPYKTYASTSEMRALASTRAAKPPGLFTFLAPSEPFAAVAATPASHATVTFGPNTVTRWDWDAATSKWKRSINGFAQRTDGGTQLAFTNVIIQTVPYRGTPYRDQAGSPVDEAVTTGSGDAILLTGGQRVPLRWSKATDKALTLFTDSAGRSIRLPTGQTWVVLAPKEATIAVVNPTAATPTTAGRLTR